MRAVKIAAALALALAFCIGVGYLAGRLVPGAKAQCYQIDRFGELCIQGSAEMFVERAHGEYEWIRRHYGDWKAGDFGGCCGKDDCFPVKARYDHGRQGWHIEDEFGGFVPDKEARPSHDPEGRHWRCYSMGRDAAGKPVPRAPRTSDGKPCFFPSRGDG